MTWILPRQLHTLASALDTAALSLDLNEQSQVCAQSLFVRSKPSPSAIWLRKWKRDSWTRHLSGRILRPSLGQRFATEWTSSLGATHASPSVQPANAKVSKTRGIFGRLLQMAFDFSDPAAASLRTSKDISAWGCPTSSKTWQEWVIERRGAYSQRLNAERHTSGNGCSSWPTVSVNESKNSVGGSQVDRKSIPLGTMAVMHGHHVPASSSTDGSRPGLWQTATVSTGAHRQKDGSMTDKLDQQVKSWATPQAQEAGAKVETLFTKNGDPAFPGQRAYRKTPSGKMVLQSQTINQQVEMVEKSWATPRAGKTTDENPETWALRQAKGDVATMPLTAQVKNHTSGKLNPRWVETLMGLPVGWTMPSCASPVTIERMNSASSATESSQQQQNERSGV